MSTSKNVLGRPGKRNAAELRAILAGFSDEDRRTLHEMVLHPDDGPRHPFRFSSYQNGGYVSHLEVGSLGSAAKLQLLLDDLSTHALVRSAPLLAQAAAASAAINNVPEILELGPPPSASTASAPTASAINPAPVCDADQSSVLPTFPIGVSPTPESACAKGIVDRIERVVERESIPKLVLAGADATGNPAPSPSSSKTAAPAREASTGNAQSDGSKSVTPILAASPATRLPAQATQDGDRTDLARKVRVSPRSIFLCVLGVAVLVVAFGSMVLTRKHHERSTLVWVLADGLTKAGYLKPTKPQPEDEKEGVESGELGRSTGLDSLLAAFLKERNIEPPMLEKEVYAVVVEKMKNGMRRISLGTKKPEFVYDQLARLQNLNLTERGDSSGVVVFGTKITTHSSEVWLQDVRDSGMPKGE